jgi:hypothetical protein
MYYVKHSSPRTIGSMIREDLSRPIGVRLSAEMGTAIDQLAVDADVDFSRMTRRLLTYALLHMPNNWLPTKGANPATSAATAMARCPK